MTYRHIINKLLLCNLLKFEWTFKTSIHANVAHSSVHFNAHFDAEHNENTKSVSHNIYLQLQLISTGTTDIMLSVSYS
jgi:hypothetical protein